MSEAIDIRSLTNEASELIGLCRARNVMLASAESCTGGLIAALLTEIPGSSAVFDRGFVTYSNEAKSEMLGVPPEMIETDGAVSKDVALAMVEGALANSAADIVVAVTGIAGPDGGTDQKPVGLVHIAAGHQKGERAHRRCIFQNRGRHFIRVSTVKVAFDMIRQLAGAEA